MFSLGAFSKAEIKQISSLNLVDQTFAALKGFGKEKSAPSFFDGFSSKIREFFTRRESDCQVYECVEVDDDVDDDDEDYGSSCDDDEGNFFPFEWSVEPRRTKILAMIALNTLLAVIVLKCAFDPKRMASIEEEGLKSRVRGFAEFWILSGVFGFLICRYMVRYYPPWVRKLHSNAN